MPSFRQRQRDGVCKCGLREVVHQHNADGSSKNRAEGTPSALHIELALVASETEKTVHPAQSGSSSSKYMARYTAVSDVTLSLTASAASGWLPSAH